MNILALFLALLAFVVMITTAPFGGEILVWWRALGGWRWPLLGVHAAATVLSLTAVVYFGLAVLDNRWPRP